MAQLRLGGYLEACPGYQRAVALQKAKDQARLALTAPVLVEETHVAQPVQFILVRKPTGIEERRERERYTEWLLLADYNSQVPSVDCIIIMNGRRYNVTEADIKGKSRIEAIINARFDAMAECQDRRSDKSLCEISKYFNRHHTSLINALRKRGIQERHRKTIDRVKALELYQAGFDTNEIADQLGFAVETVRKATASVERRVSVSERTHKKIMQYASDDLSVRQIASLSGYHINTVREHLSGQKRVRT